MWQGRERVGKGKAGRERTGERKGRLGRERRGQGKERYCKAGNGEGRRKGGRVEIVWGLEGSTTIVFLRIPS